MTVGYAEGSGSLCNAAAAAAPEPCPSLNLLTAQLTLDLFFSLQSQKRYHEDIFGAVFPHGVKKDRAERPPGDNKL